MKKLVIIGGSDAGISAALRARELDSTIEPLMIVADRYPNFSICGLPYYISRDVKNWQNLAHRTEKDIVDEGIKLLLEYRAEKIDPDNKTVIVRDTSGIEKTIEYEKLVIGTGAVSFRPGIKGMDLPGVFFLRWMTDLFAIDDYIERRKPKTALIIGAGYIGMEMSEALTSRGIKVTVAEYAPSIMPSVDAHFGQKIREALRNEGVTIQNNVAVESISTGSDSLVISGGDDFQCHADMVLVAAGSVPNTEIGKKAGIQTGLKGAFRVNRKMETNIPDIYAAGDCVETWHRVLQEYSYIPLGTIAHKQGRVAGANATGFSEEFAGSLGTQSVKILNYVVARTGLSEKEARDAGFDPVSTDLETWDHKVYFPPAEKIHIRVIADRTTKRILGAQMLGAYKTEVSKRIDIFAAAIYHQVTVQEFSNYDLSYTPPLSSPWDPVQMAVQKLEQIMNSGY
jgi:NADPH-dependent 2,4-dienoyl-CoA reductase/sulfur reductase-like enzyme